MMCAEEVHKIAKKIGMPSYMFDTDSALFWLSRFAKEADTPRPEAEEVVEINTYWAFVYSDGSIWTDDIFSSKNAGEKFAKGESADLVDGATLCKVVIKRLAPQDGSKK